MEVLVTANGKGEIYFYTVTGNYLTSFKPEESLAIQEITSSSTLKTTTGDYLLIARYVDNSARVISFGKREGHFTTKVEFDLSFESANLRINVTGVETYQSNNGQVIVTSDDQGILRFYNNEGKLIESIQTAHPSIKQIVRKMRRLGIVGENMISFLEIGMEQMKISDVVCDSGSYTFKSIAFDLYKTTGMIFAATEQGDVLVLSPSKTQTGSECRLLQVLSIGAPNTEIIMTAFVGNLYVLTKEKLLAYDLSKAPLTISFSRPLPTFLNVSEEVVKNASTRSLFLRKEFLVIGAGNLVTTFEAPSTIIQLLQNFVWFYPIFFLFVLVFGGYRIFKFCSRPPRRRMEPLRKDKRY